ncbi:chemokine-like factor isoform X3 [Erinaceus europaeus]|nr:chemokine-like factor isoform X3 [Erinaceus europaeus]
MTFFILAQAPEPYIVITGFEVTVILFFILLYMLRLDRLMNCLFWPLLDIINSMVTAVFMIIVSVLALIPETTFFIVLGGILLVAALSVFLTADAHESYIAITVLEICIVLFFILVYVLTLHHLLLCLDWHLFDLINSFITSVFLLVVAASAIKEQQRKQLFFTGGMLCLIAALLCIIDAILVTRGMRNKLKKLLGFKVETQQVRVVKEIPEKGATKVLSRTVITSSTPAAPTQPPGPAPAPTQPPGSAPTKAVSRAPSPTSMAPPRAPTKSTKRPSTRT